MCVSLRLANSAKSLFAAVAEPDAPGPIRCYKFPLDGALAKMADVPSSLATRAVALLRLLGRSPLFALP